MIDKFLKDHRDHNMDMRVKRNLDITDAEYEMGWNIFMTVFCLYRFNDIDELRNSECRIRGLKKMYDELFNLYKLGNKDWYELINAYKNRKKNKRSMIKPQELRIGNLIMQNDVEVKVWGIERGFIKYKEVGENSPIVYGEPNRTFTGIPITEEWLLKFGFEKTKDNLKTYKFDYIEVYEQDDIWWIDLNNISVEIYFVHQFQNICFYYLGGEELTIKE